MLGVFSLPAFTRLGHECQGLVESMRWNACVHRLDFDLYSYPKEFFLGMESEPMLTSSVKSPLPEAQTRIEPATLHHARQRAQHTLDGATPAQIGDQKETSTQREIERRVALRSRWQTDGQTDMDICRSVCRNN